MLVYLGLSAIVGVIASPVFVAVDAVLLTIYIGLITIATRRDEPVLPSIVATTRGRDLGMALALVATLLAAATIFWTPQSLSVYQQLATLFAHALPEAVAGKAANAMLAFILLLLPTVALVLMFRLRATAIGLLPRYVGLGLLLAAIDIGLAAAGAAAHAPVEVLWRAFPLGTAFAILGLQSMVNGIPEELAFRGVVTSRLLPWLGRPGNALVVSAVVFSLFHVPSALANPGGRPAWENVLGVLLPGLQMTGLVWGYLWYRTRSIWPGVIWHTAISGFGVMFA